MSRRNLTEAIKILKRGGIGILPTDTIYGLIGSALNRQTVKRVYEVRKRNPQKPFIILIGSIDDLLSFGIRLDSQTRKLINSFWPGQVSVVLPCPDGEFHYLHRGVKKLAFRLPKLPWLRSLLKQTGPLVAPSANPEGLVPAKTIEEAREYFGQNVDFYVDGGKISGKSSTLVAIENSKIKLLRPGLVKIK